MTRFLIFLFPAMMDMVLGTVMYITAFRLSESNASGFAVGATAAVWALVYSILTAFSGKFVTYKNCSTIIIISGIMTVFGSAGFIIFPGLYQQFIFIAVTGVGTALFFQPFQMFMKAVEQGRPQGIVRSTALYTFSWSAGMASGPFISAFVWRQWSWQACYWVNIVLSIIIVIGVLLLKHHAQKQPKLENNAAEQPQSETKPAVDYSKFPDLAWMGWIVAGAGCLTVAIVRSLLPYKASSVSMDKTTLGLVLAAVSYTQAFVGLSFWLGKTWMYKFFPALILSISGIAGLLLFTCGSTAGAFFAAAILYGIYSGYFFFSLVFHSLVHPEKCGVYVAINEVIVGCTSVIGPLFGGYLADLFTPSQPFLLVCIPVALAVIIQFFIYRAKKIKIS